MQTVNAKPLLTKVYTVALFSQITITYAAYPITEVCYFVIFFLVDKNMQHQQAIYLL